MKHVFIVNLLSGGGRGHAMVKNIERVCQEECLEYEIRATEAPGDGRRIAKEYMEDECIIYAVGGDGTINEVLNGVVGSNNILGVIPCGSGNDFYRTLKIWKDGIHKIDVGIVNGLYFVNIMCIGMDAEIADNVSLMKAKGIKVSRLYPSSIVYTYFKYKFKNSMLRFNDVEESGEFSIMTVCNAQFYGGGYRIAPKAELDDGLFDIYWAPRVKKIVMPYLMLKIKGGNHQDSKVIHNSRTTEVEITSEQKLICNVDGERLIDNHFHVEILPKAVTIYNNKKLINRFLEINEAEDYKETVTQPV